MDEEALKHNTDCVYFLASPLTCKKGITCQFRHSEAARLHPRDCWYWLGGNCLNAKCPFRHPPLDGRPASVLASAPASSVPSKATPAPSTSTISSSRPANKSKTPCYYFSQGYCSRGNRCAFLHGSLSSKSAQPAAAQKLPEGSTGKGPETNNKPMIKVELNCSSVQTTTVHALPSYVYVRAQKTPLVDNDAPLPESSQEALSLKCLSGESPIVKMSKPSVHPNIQAPSINLPDSHDRSDCKKLCQQQPKCTEVEHLIEVVSSAEAKQSLEGEGLKEGTWRERLSKDVCQDFENEPDNTFYGEDNGYFGRAGSEKCNIPLSPDVESYEWPEQVHGNGCQQSLSNLKKRHFSPSYLARGDRYRINDLRDHLGKRRISCQDQFSDFGGHIEAFEDHGYFDERDLVDKMESARSESERKTSWRNFKRAICKSPVYDHGWDAEGENAQISSARSPLMYLTRYGPRSKPYGCEDELYNSKRTRCHSESDRGRSLWTQLGARVDVVGCFQTERETHSGSCSSNVSQILSASGSDRGQVAEELNNFEGPKPLSVLLQEKRK